MPRKRYDCAVGERFGKLTVIELAPMSWDKSARVLCQCDCGKTTIVRVRFMNSGNTKSCGCLRGQAGGVSKAASVKKKVKVYEHHFWKPAKIQELIEFAARPGITYKQIAAHFGVSIHSAIAKMNRIGLIAVRDVPPPRVKSGLSPVWFPQFEDVENPDADRNIGRRPQKQYNGSLMGCSSAMCSNG